MTETPPIDPEEAIQRLLSRIEPVEIESAGLEVSKLAGRVLASEVRLDRDSPACDVSAMDGYAIRLQQLIQGPLPIQGECCIGEAPAVLPDGVVTRIYTGSPLPSGADTVVRLERATKSNESIRLNDPGKISLGDDIRLQGENAKAGSVALHAGMSLTPAAMTALSTIGPRAVEVHRSLRVAILTTGNELHPTGDTNPPAWRLRDSNGPSLAAMFGPLPWIHSVKLSHAEDQLEALTDQLASLVSEADAVVITGGVSKGAYDFVPAAVEAAGGDTLFHRLNARPGRPTLGAVIGKTPVMGLPGNPLAVLTTGRRLVSPVLRKLAGFNVVETPPPVVELIEWSGKPIPLTWWRPVRLTELGRAMLASLRGSGDTLGPALSDGFVEVPPDTQSLGPYPFYRWSL